VHSSALNPVASNVRFGSLADIRPRLGPSLGLEGSERLLPANSRPLQYGK
jgi:hypothetical protein